MMNQRMTEELEELYGRISLSEKEKIEIKVDEDDVSKARESIGKCLVGKVWTEKTVNREAFRSIMASV
jgi:hypothetical protein